MSDGLPLPRARWLAALDWTGPPRPLRAHLPGDVLVLIDHRSGGRRCVDCARFGYEEGPNGHRRDAESSGAAGAKLELDHAIALARGGRTRGDNLVWRCLSHNRAKQDRLRVRVSEPGWARRVSRRGR